MNKRKIINDPVHGFISIYSDLVFDILEHKDFQRMRRIRQLGLTDLVYPGALHTRFHHAIGAAHLMEMALKNLKEKGYDIKEEEIEATILAMLLHDIGHGPFSHVLEHTILQDVQHEHLSLLFMRKLNTEFSGKLGLAMEIFSDKYPKKFLHQLVSSQLDMDRLDYLNRDSYFTGVVEGLVESERIIKMLEVVNDSIAIQEKGIYSIENFLNARRLMYWQVYLHKTTIAAEEMLIQIIRRAKYLAKNAEYKYTETSLGRFLQHQYTKADFEHDYSLLNDFALLDDFDIWNAVKAWTNHPDEVLSMLSKMLMERKLFKIVISPNDFEEAFIRSVNNKIRSQYAVSMENLSYLSIKGSLSNLAYLAEGKNINILRKDGSLVDIAEASDLPNIKAISNSVTKYYYCRPFDIVL